MTKTFVRQGSAATGRVSDRSDSAAIKRPIVVRVDDGAAAVCRKRSGRGKEHRPTPSRRVGRNRHKLDGTSVPRFRDRAVFAAESVLGFVLVRVPRRHLER